MLFFERLNRILLQYLRLDSLTTLLHKLLALGLDREWRHFTSRALIFLLTAVDELKCGVFVEVHARGYHSALGAKDGTLPLRSNE